MTYDTFEYWNTTLLLVAAVTVFLPLIAMVITDAIFHAADLIAWWRDR